MKKILVIAVAAMLCLNAKAQYRDLIKARAAKRTITINTYESYGYIYKDWVQYHLDKGRACVYRDGYPEYWDKVHISIPAEVIYKGNKYVVDGIKDYAWKDAYNILSFDLPDAITHIPVEAFRNCYSATAFRLPAKLQVIDDWAFARTPITRLYLPDSVKVINSYAFNECSKLRYIELPANLIHIGKQAFHGCESLDTVKVKFSIPITIERSTFYKTITVRKPVLLVPEGSTDVFRVAPGWNSFDIQEYSL